MTDEQATVIDECIAASLAGTASFGEIVARLIGIGVERYHTDYSRHETTYYLADGQSRVVAASIPVEAIADAFSARAVEAAVRASQRGEIRFPEFVRRTTAGGCVGYFVQITGARVQYFGRRGEVHTELFPGAR